jgi:hypothetical protein
MRNTFGVAVVLLMAYGVDQFFNGGRGTNPIFAFLSDFAHGFGFGG